MRGPHIRVVDVLTDNRVGGVAIRVLGMAKALKQCNIHSTVVLPFGDGGFAGKLLENGVDAVQLRFLRPSPRSVVRNVTWMIDFIPSVFRFIHFLLRTKPDVVQVNGLVAIQPALAALFLGIPLVWVLASDAYPLWLVAVLRPLVRRAKRIVPISRKIKSFYGGDRLDAARTIVVPESIDMDELESFYKLDELRNVVRAELGISAEAVVSISVANVTPVKNHFRMIKAFEKIQAECQNAFLLIVGAEFPTHAKYVEALKIYLKRRRLDHYVRLLGVRYDVYRLLKAADIFVLSSDSEGTPIAIIEAMGMGIPILSTNVGGIEDQVENGVHGFLIDRDDNDGYSRAWVRLIQSASLRRELGGRARERVIRELTRQVQVVAFEKIYREISETCVG